MEQGMNGEEGGREGGREGRRAAKGFHTAHLL
jgi:hypothetical protein